ncbi:NUDIX hydrolase [Tomitella fengzijianii]|uniref:NUDIX hydrolase n=1 Tax=Tomitella fengzijianii TaxID=2597660 RepID=A0A516X9B2_9ACTN|nr:NUDIX hydrolase [Tomitella fengzijianii]
MQSGPAQQSSTVHAAGTVLWRYRGTGAKREFAVVHRPEYDDWSLPKGKLDPGESAPAAAVRETVEETGYSARLGRYLQSVSYPLSPRRTKTVDYWEAQAVGGSFLPNSEVDELRWVRFRHAVEMVTHDLDRAVLARFRARRPGDSTLLLIRHARAGRRGRFDGPDTARPLDAKGREQARRLVAQTAAFRPAVVYSADRARCVDTVAPLARELRTDVVLEPTLSEEAYALDPGAALRRIQEIARGGRVAAVCSQSGVIPDLLRWWSARDGMTLPTATTRKADTWVLTLRAGRLIAADRLPAPSPVAS